jgi:hypothetical protein
MGQRRRLQGCFFGLLCLAPTTFCTIAFALSEDERLAGYAARNYSWPMRQMVPDTPGWEAIMRRRISQIEAMDMTERDDKYNAWISVMTEALLPNFTQFGWGATKAPPEIVEKIQHALHSGLSSAEEEEEDRGIVGDFKPLFVRMPDLVEEAMLSLQKYFEAWVGFALRPTSAYGLRIYRNNSQLYMHVDKLATHVISGIFHIDHSDDAEPWPLLIEDFEGKTQVVYLDKGDILFYESAKCVHGRPIPFRGSFYTSLFLHYAPDYWDSEKQVSEPHFAIPPHWQEQHHFRDLPRLQMVDTAMIEPHCLNQWCISDAIDSYGPRKHGIVTLAHGIERNLDIASGNAAGGRGEL